ncbi:6675_t:CDS:10 [Funneliformis geosporum]|uniref:6675_t:CDS:1 n=1 Tax=Funneliformis geosporum TaxID=1117311 RepID=A0A9W4WLS2_9GLOM|nr:6675_t:CDS:10 [Funneliformis geosporum]
MSFHTVNSQKNKLSGQEINSTQAAFKNIPSQNSIGKLDSEINSEVDCGNNRHCQAGQQCASNNTCIPLGAKDCGNSTYCDADRQCAFNNRCIPVGTNDCGTFYCNAGLQCAFNNACIPVSAIDCGTYYCDAGKLCASGDSCMLLVNSLVVFIYNVKLNNNVPLLKCIPSVGTSRVKSTVELEYTGQQCASENRCIPAGAVDCGTHFCDAGHQCASIKRCIPPGAVDCLTHFCAANQQCASNATCIPAGGVDCGTHNCRPGEHCGPEDSCIPPGKN